METVESVIQTTLTMKIATMIMKQVVWKEVVPISMTLMMIEIILPGMIIGTKITKTGIKM